MPETVADDDDRPRDGDEDQDASEDDLDIGDMDVAALAAKFDLDRLRTAIRFVQDDIPPFGHQSGGDGMTDTGASVPPGLIPVRVRALIAAYGFIERSFSPREGHQ